MENVSSIACTMGVTLECGYNQIKADFRIF